MGAYVIQGGNKLRGSVKVESAKNAVLPILCGALLTKEEVVVRNCPKIGDVESLIDILKMLGVEIEWMGKDIRVKADTVVNQNISQEYSTKLRSSVFLIGAMISRFGEINTSYPGGCAIGQRPIDIHISAMEQLGVHCVENEYGLRVQCVAVEGAKITLSFPSVGATENVILASVFCHGETILQNAALEPEIEDLANFLNSMGADIVGAGTSTVIIKGVKSLHGTDYTPIGDRIEAGTFLCGFLMTGGEGEIQGIKRKNIEGLLNIFNNNTCKIYTRDDIIYTKCSGRLSCLQTTTAPFPYFPTDMQSQITALACCCKGRSFIREMVFENRFNHVAELIKMGAMINIENDCIVVDGVERLQGCQIRAKDLRGGAGLVLAGLVAEGQTTVLDCYHIDRGYDSLDKKLCSLGARITKVE